MDTIKHGQLIKLFYRFLRVIWGIQWLVLGLTIIYSLFGLNFNTFFSFNYSLAISDVPLYLDQPGWLELSDGSRYEFLMTSALGKMHFLNDPGGLIRLFAFREILYQSVGLFIVLLVIRICKSLLEKAPFTTSNASRLRIIALFTLGASIFNSIFIFQLGRFLNGKIDAGMLKANINTHLDYPVLLFGLLLLVISEVFRIGVKIQEEQRLII